jgi:hypothetical protein
MCSFDIEDRSASIFSGVFRHNSSPNVGPAQGIHVLQYVYGMISINLQNEELEFHRCQLIAENLACKNSRGGIYLLHVQGLETIDFEQGFHRICNHEELHATSEERSRHYSGYVP